MGNKARLAVLAITLCVFASGLAFGEPEGMPELHLYKLVLDEPSPVVRGEKVSVQAWVMNTGARQADAFTMDFFYRAAHGQNWESFLEGPVSIPTLATSRQHPLLETKVFDTNNLDPGVYELRVVVDSDNRIPEGDESNNELVTTLTVLPSKAGTPDIQPLRVSFEPTSPSGGESLKVLASWANSGDKDAPLFRVSFRVDGREFALFYQDFLGIGAVSDYQVALAPDDLGLSPGTHRLDVVVDADDQVDEQDEQNNALTAYLTIHVAELHPISLTYDQPQVHLDGSTTVATTVRNTGKGKAAKVEVAFSVNNQRFALVDAGPLAAMEEKSVEAELIPANLPGQLPPGGYQLAVSVDPNTVVTELDEQNNSMSKSLTLLEAEPRSAELHPESLEVNPPSPVELGLVDAVTLSSVVKNTGRTATAGFDVEFAYRVKGALRWQAVPCSDAVSCSNLTLDADREIKVNGLLSILGLSPGLYEIRVEVDPGLGVIAELDETNNTLVTTLAVHAPRLPDLTIDPWLAVEVAPSTLVSRGQTLRFKAHVSNLGEIPAGRFDVHFLYSRVSDILPSESLLTTVVSEVLFAADTIQGLGVGETAVAEAILETSGLEPGRYNIRVSVDPSAPGSSVGEVTERDELNNALDIPVDVQGADLLAVDLRLMPSTTAVQGESVELLGTVLNIGVEPAGSFCVTFYGTQANPGGSRQAAACSVSCAGDCSVLTTGECGVFGVGGTRFPGLDVGSAETVSCVLDTSLLDPGVYQIVADVDPNDAVSEQNELNNQVAATLVLLPRPADLVVDTEITFDPPPPVDPGTPVEVSGTVYNDGGTAANEFEVSFIYRALGSDGESPLTVEFGRTRVETLLPGTELPVHTVLDTTGLGGNYEVCILVDPSNTVLETDEENNATCVPPPFTVTVTEVTSGGGVPCVDLACVGCPAAVTPTACSCALQLARSSGGRLRKVGGRLPVIPSDNYRNLSDFLVHESKAYNQGSHPASSFSNRVCGNTLWTFAIRATPGGLQPLAELYYEWLRDAFFNDP